MANSENKSNLVVVVNAQKTLEYFRNKPLTIKQEEDLLEMDAKLNRGLELAGERIERPSMQDKATFLANHLASAIARENEAASALACAYLATRYVDLKQIIITDQKDRVSIQLIYDNAYQEQTPLTFIPKKDLK